METSTTDNLSWGNINKHNLGGDNLALNNLGNDNLNRSDLGKDNLARDNSGRSDFPNCNLRKLLLSRRQNRKKSQVIEIVRQIISLEGS